MLVLGKEELKRLVFQNPTIYLKSKVTLTPTRQSLSVTSLGLGLANGVISTVHC